MPGFVCRCRDYSTRLRGLAASLWRPPRLTRSLETCHRMAVRRSTSRSVSAGKLANILQYGVIVLDLFFKFFYNDFRWV